MLRKFCDVCGQEIQGRQMALTVSVASPFSESHKKVEIVVEAKNIFHMEDIDYVCVCLPCIKKTLVTIL